MGPLHRDMFGTCITVESEMIQSITPFLAIRRWLVDEESRRALVARILRHHTRIRRCVAERLYPSNTIARNAKLSFRSVIRHFVSSSASEESWSQLSLHNVIRNECRMQCPFSTHPNWNCKVTLHKHTNNFGPPTSKWAVRCSDCTHDQRGNKSQLHARPTAVFFNFESATAHGLTTVGALSISMFRCSQEIQ